MTDQRLYWIWLTTIPSVGPIIQKKLLKHFKRPKRIFDAEKGELSNLFGAGSVLAERIWAARSLDGAKETFERMNKKDIHFLTMDDSHYPREVREIPNAPIVLYYRGRLIENRMGIGIIGTRRCTSYGKQVTIDVADFLARNNIPVISGMAKGIDGYAHTACLKAGGYTIGFLGSGVDICYPKEHQSLMEKMIDQGAVLSSYPPGTPVHPRHFYQRNFLISAWSNQVLVVEAGEKSGTLTTVDFAKKLKRDIWAVPNHIYCQESKGTNQLIAGGASIFLDPEQLISLGMESPPFSPPQPFKSKISQSSPVDSFIDTLNHFEKRMVEELKIAPQSINQLAELMKKNHAEIIESLSLLELEGFVSIKPNQMVELASYR